MEDFQKRVVVERDDLEEKAKALSDFIGNSPLFNEIVAAEQERLKVQNDIMWQYYEVLNERIQNF